MDKHYGKGVSVVIPCLNESETIGRAVIEAREALKAIGVDFEVIVADNGSTDGSQGIAEIEGARVVPVAEKGYGAALDGGILAARYSCVCFGDADLSYPFNEIGNLTKPVLDGRAEFVLGSRLNGTIATGAMPFLNRHLGTPVLSFLIRRLYGLPISDCNSGMRAIATEKYKSLALKCPGMEYASEMLIKTAKQKLTYAEVPINFRKDQRSRAPHLRRWRDGWRHLRFILGNGPANFMIGVPYLTGLLAMSFAMAISLRDLWAPEAPIHYHTAFVMVAFASSLMMFANAILMTQIAMQDAFSRPARLVRWAQTLAEKNWPVRISLLCMVLAAVQIGFMMQKWARIDFGLLQHHSGTVRLMALVSLGTVFFSMDIGMGILALLQRRSSVCAKCAEPMNDVTSKAA